MAWKTLSSTELFKSGFFKLRSDRCQLPDGREMPRYFVVEFSDWVNILPITPEGKVVLVKQYRHASGQFHLELPGGSMEPGTGESLAEGARREMVEETGYDSPRIVKVGSHYPNPALQNNQMHTFIAFDSVLSQSQSLDEFEDLEVVLCTLDELKDHLANGRITHSLMIASVALALNYLNAQKENS